MKKRLSLALTLLLCLSLAACGSDSSDDWGNPDEAVGNDWRITGIVRDGGIITRGGTDTGVLVCVNADSADFYLDDAVQTLYGYVDYPVPLQGDPWEAFQSIDFADRNGDGSSDAAMQFELDGQQVLMVWLWDADTEKYVFQREASQIPERAPGASAADNENKE